MDITKLTKGQQKTLLAQLYRSSHAGTLTTAERKTLDELMHANNTMLRLENGLYAKVCMIPNHDDDVAFVDNAWQVIDFEDIDGNIENFIMLDCKRVKIYY